VISAVAAELASMSAPSAQAASARARTFVLCIAILPEAIIAQEDRQ
jgi:hypothetical protein